MKKFFGTGVALVTPFKSDFSIDFDGLKRLLKHVTEGGAEYLVVLGTTGESATLNGDEKKEVLSFIKQHNYKNLPIVYGLGGNDTRELLKKINEIDWQGVDAVLSVCPYYNKPSQAGIIAHYTQMADACPVPVMLYNIPGRTGVNMTADTTLTLSKHKNIIGIKEASGDLAQCIDIAKYKNDDFLLIGGDDILTVPIISIGGVGAISAISNVFPDITSAMARYALASDFPKANQELHKFCHFNRMFFEEGNPVGVKAMLSIMGICEPYVRLPLSKASDTLTQKLKSAYQQSF